MDRFDSDPLCSVEQIEKTVEGDRSVEFIALGPMRQVVGSGRITHAGSGSARDPCLTDMFVRPSFRRRGVGTALTEAAQKWAEDEGRPLYLYVQTENEPAKALYASVGFERTECPRSWSAHWIAQMKNRVWMVG